MGGLCPQPALGLRRSVFNCYRMLALCSEVALGKYIYRLEEST